MNVGIIAEYNPFHKGHALHINNTRALTNADSVIAVISGSFVQRGEPAILDKFERTRAALENGVDMVLELPVPYATGAADVFAYGAVDTLNKSGIVDMLSFGTEAGDIELFKDAANLLVNETTEFKALLHNELDNGTSYAAARQNALSQALGRDLDFLSKPNNILALEYLKSLLRLNSDIKPITIRREVNEYSSKVMTGNVSSAAAIRHSLKNGEWDIALSAVPHNTCDMLKKVAFGTMPDIDAYSEVLKYILLNKSPEYLAQIDEISEGLENRILANANLATVSEITDAVKSKRYTHSRVRRALLHILLDIKKEDADIENGVKYIRVLGFRRDKASLVSDLCERAKVPVVTNVKKAENEIGDLLKKDIFATNMYYMPYSGEKNKDYTMPLVIV
jgi:predicted nucleotidyltransferase